MRLSPRFFVTLMLRIAALRINNTQDMFAMLILLEVEDSHTMLMALDIEISKASDMALAKFITSILNFCRKLLKIPYLFIETVKIHRTQSPFTACTLTNL